MITVPPKARILIARTDNIGDLILSLPVAALLKEKFPQAEIYFLARAYASFIATSCPYVDGYINWDELSKQPARLAVDQLKKFDVFVSLYPQKAIAKLAAKAKIPYRLGTSHRLYHWLYCNKRVSFTRKNSELHEAQLNTKLLKPFDINTNLSLEELKHYTAIDTPLDSDMAKLLSQDKFNLILHPGSNGNGREWPQQNFVQLIQQLDANKYNIFVTGLAHEQERFHELLGASPNIINMMGKCNLNQFVSLICHSDGLVAASTGPLHIAAAAGIQTLGVFPPQAIIGPERWGPLGNKAEYITSQTSCNTSCSNTECPCLANISANDVTAVIGSWNKIKQKEFC